MILMICVFSQQKFQAWVLKKGVDIASATEDSYFDEDYQFSYDKDGLNFAIAFTAYDSAKELILDPSFGKLVFNSWSWGFNSDFTTERAPLKTHPCTDAELGLNEAEESIFYPTRKNARKIVENHKKKFICLDETSEMFISGSYNSDKARLFNIQLVRCSDQDEQELGIKCKSQTEITEFMSNKFLYMLYNQRRFQPQEYFDDSVVSESNGVWLPVNTHFQQTIPYRVSKTQVELQDHNIDLDELTILEDDTIFKLEKLANQPYQKDKIVQMDVTIEFNLDLTILDRTRYNFLDVLSDIGGIQSMISSFFFVFVGIWNYKHFDTYLASRLYKIYRPYSSIKQLKYVDCKDGLGGNLPPAYQLKFIKLKRFCNFGHYFMDLLPKFCRRCCRTSRQQRAMDIALKHMDGEINIVEIVKSRRYFKSALQLLLSREQRLNMREQSNYICIDPSDDQQLVDELDEQQSLGQSPSRKIQMNSRSQMPQKINDNRFQGTPDISSDQSINSEDQDGSNDQQARQSLPIPGAQQQVTEMKQRIEGILRTTQNDETSSQIQLQQNKIPKPNFSYTNQIKLQQHSKSNSQSESAAVRLPSLEMKNLNRVTMDQKEKYDDEDDDEKYDEVQQQRDNTNDSQTQLQHRDQTNEL